MSARTRPGLALVALGVIIAVTVAWWALALVPITSPAPEWVLRTRLACFGAGPDGLPNAGGWVLLVGEPIGMLAVLCTVWRDALRRDLRLVEAQAAGRLLLRAVGVGLAWGAVWSAARVRTALAAAEPRWEATPGSPVRVAGEAPSLMLSDQHGRRFDLAQLRGRPVIVTFAYAHCATVCPTIVRGIQRARAESGRPDIPIVVVTLDPWRDVAARLPAVADAWDLASGDRLLGGEVDEVNAVLDAWGVRRERDARTGEIDHTPAVLVVDRDGRLAWRLGGDVRALGSVLGTT